MDPLPPPSRLYLDLTDACPLRCRHCCSSSGARREGELSVSELVSLMDQAKALGVRDLVLSGGEPLARPEFAELAGEARNRDFRVTLLTSGVLLDREAARLVARLGLRPKLSLDGVRAATHDAIRGTGAFERTLAALRLLVAAGAAETAVHFTANRENLAELELLPALLEGLGIRDLMVGLVKPAGRAALNEELLIPPAMLPYVKDRVGRLGQDPRVRLLSITNKGWKGFGCAATCDKLGVGATGLVTTCVFFGEARIEGNARRESLGAIWRRRLAVPAFVANPTCAACGRLEVTGGGCRARALHATGDINGVDPYCCALGERAARMAASGPGSAAGSAFAGSALAGSALAGSALAG